jgi:hypothetical protein
MSFDVQVLFQRCALAAYECLQCLSIQVQASMQEAMHAISLLAPKATEVAATLEQNTRRLDALIKASGAMRYAHMMLAA